jgi:hypothetical protein
MKQIKKFMVLTLAFGMLFMGCSKLNQENYEKIEMGMEYEQVVGIIGNPDKCDAALGTKNCVWGNDEKHITVKFIGDKVLLPSMKGL